MREIDWRSCFTMSDMPELEKLDEWARGQSEKLSREIRSLEIGSFQGATASILAQYGPVLCCDPFTNVDSALTSADNFATHDHFRAFIDNMHRLGLIERVHAIVSTSSALGMMTPQNLDFAFIDGCHTYEAVSLDIKRVDRHLAKWGLMIFHDYRRPGFGYPPFDPNHPHHGPVDPWGGVAKAVDELLRTSTFTIYEHFMGITALERV